MCTIFIVNDLVGDKVRAPVVADSSLIDLDPKLTDVSLNPCWAVTHAQTKRPHLTSLNPTFSPSTTSLSPGLNSSTSPVSVTSGTSTSLSQSTCTKNTPSNISVDPYSFDSRFLPQFTEQDPEAFFLVFQRVATQMSIPKEHWTLLVQAQFVGKAQDVYQALSVHQSSYSNVKEKILKAYALVPETYQTQSPGMKKQANHTFPEYSSHLWKALDWQLKSSKFTT